MEIMTTASSVNGHNSQKELRLFAPSAVANTSEQINSTSLTATNGARSPFQREVREWQRIDPDTGALLTGRLEADRWVNGPLNSYGKISDSKNISQPNGTQQTQHKQLEVIQTCTAGGAAMQVIRSQTVQTTSSRWSTPSSSATASPSPTSLLQQSYSQTVRETALPSNKKTTTTVTKNSHNKSTALKDKFSKSTQKRTTTATRTTTTKASKTFPNASYSNSSPLAPAMISSTDSKPFGVTNGFGHSRNSPVTNSKIKSSSLTSRHTHVNGHKNDKHNWPQIVTENMSSSSILDICNNDHDNEHVHDNDYIVEEQLSDNDTDDNRDNVVVVNGNNPIVIDNDNNSPVELHENNSNSHYLLHKISSFRDNNDDDNNNEEAINDAVGDNKKFYLSNNLPNYTRKQSSQTRCGIKTNHTNTGGNDDNDDDDDNDDNYDDLCQHPNFQYDLHNGHCSSSNSSLNSHSGNSCSNSNQLFLLDTAPSLKLSNLMKSSSSISNSSNNSTTTSATTSTNTVNINSSMNTHHHRHQQQQKSVNKNLSLHAIVGSTTANDHMTKATASSTPSPTPSPTTTTTKPSWQQPTLFRQNSNRFSPIQLATQSNKPNSSSHSRLMKSRVGDNNCCGSSSDESRSYTDNRNHHPLQQQHQQRHSPTTFQLSQQNDRLTPTQSTITPLRQHHQPHHHHHYHHNQHRTDLESFRHYSNNISDTYIGMDAETAATTAAAGDADINHDGLRLSSRHLRRQQIPRENYSPLAITTSATTTTSLQRSRSISTDDLSTEWDINGNDNEEPGEWRRVSKLRRSFQSASTKAQPSPTSVRRPLDLPPCSVSVSKIRAELENGRRLNTVMKNNHVDLAALSSILNGSDKTSPKPERSSFLTAESLKEIRGKLKKLSDESLYKEDFLISQQTASGELPEHDHIEVQAPTIRRSVDRSPDRFRGFVQKDLRSPVPSVKHTTNSLESRLKYKETNPIEWHLRRKSYGFEKMSPPDKSMQRMDASTDSGLGRSGELPNWSPTQTNGDNSRTGAVVVRFGERSSPSSAVQRRYKPQKSYEESENSHEEDGITNKRHSIAVDESKYVSDNGRQTTQVRVNGFHESSSSAFNNEGKFSMTTEYSNTSSAFSQRGQQKRVEFCKTEVHFATESGRVNIVETDSKPPPTNNFRRRRSRSSSVGPLQSLVKSATTVSTSSSSSSTSASASATSSSVAMPVTLFGDDKLRRKTIASTTVAYRAPLMESPDPLKDSMKSVTVTVPETSYGPSESSRSSYASTSGVDTTDCETDEMTSLRGILKNKPAKPKPYVLGENIDKPDDLWGVQLKPVQGKHEIITRGQSDSPTNISTTTSTTSLAQLKSVAERVRQVEQQQDSTSTPTNGFSTKINLSVGRSLSPNKNWEENDLPISNVMSIKLHSPQAAGDALGSIKSIPPPIAKPRTITNIPESQTSKLHPSSANTKQPTQPFQTSLPTKDSLKIIKEARGARQLREHELSYFGIEASKLEHENKLKTKLSTNSSNTRNSPKRSLPLRRLSEETSVSTTGNGVENSTSNRKWQLDHDKPDLLKHNPIGEEEKRKPGLKPAERKSLKNKAKLNEDEEHLYENIANEITPVFKVKEVYDRKMDLQRDAMILSEMNQSADQTLRDLSDEAALKDRRRRSLQRRNSKPLETIDEKAIAEKITDTCIAVKISRSTFASEAKKTSRHSTPSPTGIKSRERTSSQSSVECCPRARSRSLSSEKEYENAKTPNKYPRSGQMVRHKSHKSQGGSRSSSMDSQRSYHSQYSSGEEQPHQQQQQQQQPTRNSFRREDRSRAKTKRITASSTNTSSMSNHRHEKSSKSSSHGESKRSSSTTHSSMNRERVECTKDNANGHVNSSNGLTQAHCGKSHQPSASALHRSTPLNGSGRRHKDDLRDSQRIKRSSAVVSEKSTSERYEKEESGTAKNSASRSLREDERNNSARSSSHRLERTSDKDKEKMSKSKAHSNRSTSQQRHHERSTTSTTTTNANGQDKHRTSKAVKTKTSSSSSSTAVTADNNTTTHSKNAQQSNQYHHRQHQSSSKDHGKHERQQRSSKREESSNPSKAQEHVHGLKSAIIKTTTKLREKSRARKEKK
ncbi:uncharacterized protein LOC142223746 isoform X3 [Haematobia irritans]|uniref:uncharacterized protein LOC142223746 isoform X3 n=1 Tax=Haematobia irritans TaxID=7368 RepID=UPI003F50319B